MPYRWYRPRCEQCGWGPHLMLKLAGPPVSTLCDRCITTKQIALTSGELTEEEALEAARATRGAEEE